MVIGGVLGGIKYLKKKHEKDKEKGILVGKHTGLFSAKDFLNKGENSGILVSKLIKNIKYTDNNRTSNVTYIINGRAIRESCSGLFLTIGAGSVTTNIESLRYSLICGNQETIKQDNFHFSDNQNLEKLLEFENDNYEEVNKTPYSKKLFFPLCLKKGDSFQVFLYYTWKNSMIDFTESTSYFTSDLFPRGVATLITNLVFTSKPFNMVVYKVVSKNKKCIVSRINNITKEGSLYSIRWGINNPEGTYILQRSFKKDD